MSDLADFLLARIAEDEAVAQLSITHGTGGFPTSYGQRLWNGPGQYPVMAAQRLLAECSAKRRIVERLGRATDVAWSGSYAVRDDALDSLRDLALPYADHPDYDEAWRV